jgi:hypothetical protein
MPQVGAFKKNPQLRDYISSLTPHILLAENLKKGEKKYPKTTK